MATFLNEPYSTFSKRLTDWLNTAGGEVTNLTLDLFNRAQYVLWAYRAWSSLIQQSTLTLVSNTVPAANFPAGFGGIICAIGIDTNSDGKLDRFFYKDGDVAWGYKIINSFSKATGHSWAITFFSTPSANPILVYPKALDDFAGSGTEYSYFPPELLISQAQVTHIEEAGLVGNEYQAIINKHEKLLRDYEQAHQYQNIEMRMRQLDNEGDEISNEAYDMAGGSDSARHQYFDNNYDGMA
jgi:hypothetical protein